jgi:hypothetical protein
MKNEMNLASVLCPATAEELQAISGGWCGNDPLFPKGPQPTDPLRSYFDRSTLPGVDTQIGVQLGICF